MRTLKLVFGMIAALALAQYSAVYYRCTEFNYFVRQAAQRTAVQGQLKQVLLAKAGDYMLPIRDENVSVTAVGSVLRVAVEYRVPVNFFLFERELVFHTVASGPLFRD